MKQFCMKIDLISQGRENVLCLPSNMAAMTSHENTLYTNKASSTVPKQSISLAIQISRDQFEFVCSGGVVVVVVICSCCLFFFVGLCYMSLSRTVEQ